MIKYEDYNLKFELKDIDKLQEVNVGQAFYVYSVNRHTKEVVLNHYPIDDFPKEELESLGDGQ